MSTSSSLSNFTSCFPPLHRFSASCVCTKADEITAVERCGKFDGVINPGFHILGIDLFNFCIKLRTVSTRVQEVIVHDIQGRSEDGVFLQCEIVVVYEVDREHGRDAIYKLGGQQNQMKSLSSYGIPGLNTLSSQKGNGSRTIMGQYAIGNGANVNSNSNGITSFIDSHLRNIVRAHLSRRSIEQIFSNEGRNMNNGFNKFNNGRDLDNHNTNSYGTIASSELEQSFQSELQQHLNILTNHAYKIHSVLILSLEPSDQNVRHAMSEISAQRRLRIANFEKSESDKLCLVKMAEARAEMQFLEGQGLAKRRAAVVEGLRATMNLQQNSDLTKSDVNGEKMIQEFFLLTEYMTMLEKIGTGGNGSGGTMSGNLNQIINPITSSGNGISGTNNNNEIGSGTVPNPANTNCSNNNNGSNTNFFMPMSSLSEIESRIFREKLTGNMQNLMTNRAPEMMKMTTSETNKG